MRKPTDSVVLKTDVFNPLFRYAAAPLLYISICTPEVARRADYFAKLSLILVD